MWEIFEFIIGFFDSFDLFRRHQEGKAEKNNPEKARESIEVQKRNLELKSSIRGHF